MVRQRGFTIVELLIVIVVIAILSAITIVSFNGVQSRSTNSAIVSTVQSWNKILITYSSTVGPMAISPAQAGENRICLGQPSDFVASATYDAGRCLSNQGYFAYNSYQWFYDKTRDASAGVGSGLTPSVPYASNGGGPTIRGVLLNASINSQSSFIEYRLKGDVDCVIATATKSYSSGVTSCQVQTPFYLSV